MEDKTQLSSENRGVPAPNFYLKVNLKCCLACPRKAKKKIEKLYGVVAVTMDKDQGLIGVSGTIDPQILIKQFAKWGRKAQLWSPVKQSEKKEKDQDCSSHFGDSHSNASKNGANISWQHPDLVFKKPVSNQKPKKSCWFFSSFCKGKAEERSQGKGESVSSPGFRHKGVSSAANIRPFISRMGISPGYGVYGPYGTQQPPPRYRPMVYEGMAAQPLPPYGYLGSEPPPPSRRFNPMIHYTGYEDNYTY